MIDKVATNYTLLSGYENIDREKWEVFVESHPKGTIFQTPDYYELHAATKGYRPQVIAAFDEQNEMAGILVAIAGSVYPGILSYLTSRAIVCGGPLVENDNADIASLILETYMTVMRHRVIYSQFRNLHDTTVVRSVFDKIKAAYEEHLNILIDLRKTEEELWKDVKSRKRNNIRQAQRKGLSIRELVSLDEVSESYSVLEEVYHRAKLPLADKSLFMNAFEILGKKGYLKFYGTFLGETLVGTMYIFTYNSRFYDWYAGSFKQYYSYNPNDILPWKIFLSGKNAGFEIFDFGGAGKPGVPYGVRDYKIQFGGEMVNFGRYEVAHNRLVLACMQLAFKVWRRLH
jgi:lipid II:glycine glycyltransferase (peptidoglycan interpeptide bridge formation enzyme)